MADERRFTSTRFLSDLPVTLLRRHATALPSTDVQSHLIWEASLKSIKSLNLAIIAAAMSFAFAGTAFSAEATAPSPACAADMTKLCPGVEAHTDAARSCMREHRDQFSPACRSDMEARHKAMMDQISAACGADLAKFCPGGAQADEHPGRCLREHAAELSDT